MEYKTAVQRKSRVRFQQNFVTSLCLSCMIFTVVWSVYAAVSEKNRRAELATADNNSRAETSVSSAAEDDSASMAGDAASEQDMGGDMSAAGSGEQDGDNGDWDGEHPYTHPQDTADDLSDAVFIGDSRTVGMMNSTDKPRADFLCAVGLNISSVLESYDISMGDGTTGTLEQALSRRQYGRVMISFGTNEMGWPYTETFKEAYSELISVVKRTQPSAQIYLIGILPLTRSKDYEGDDVNNYNAQRFTEAIREVAAEEGVNFLDCSEAVADSEGYLPEEASSDGIHMNADYCLYWQNYIIDHT
ncbi:MAG: SGNH/GDSL hydrolase family protein [Ruminococcus sp.]|nr:SGNH/GDSL hydrolase family protein [Ruminococcus sp.]